MKSLDRHIWGGYFWGGYSEVDISEEDISEEDSSEEDDSEEDVFDDIFDQNISEEDISEQDTWIFFMDILKSCSRIWLGCCLGNFLAQGYTYVSSKELSNCVIIGITPQSMDFAISFHSIELCKKRKKKWLDTFKPIWDHYTL